jgi:uncharacterized protein YkwD
MTLPEHILAKNAEPKTTEGSLDDDSNKTIQSCPTRRRPVLTKTTRKTKIPLAKHIMDVANAMQDDLHLHTTVKSSCPVTPSNKKGELKRGMSLASHVMANNSDHEASKSSLNDDDRTVESCPAIGSRKKSTRKSTRRPSSLRSGKTRSVLKLEVDVMRDNFMGAGHYANNLVLVNRERAKVCSSGVRPLRRSVTLDETASTFAKQMAKSSGLSSQQMHTHLSANMMRGPSVRAIHAALMNRDRERDNILSADSKEFGVGTAKGEDGQLYLCQLFGGERVLLTCLDYK